MEEYNYPNTSKSLPLSDLMRIHAFYIGRPVLVYWLGQDVPLISLGVTGIDDPQAQFHFADMSLRQCPVRRVKILVRPLSKISDEDALELSRIIGTVAGPHVGTGKAYAIRISEDEADTSNRWTPPRCIEAADFLRSCGYALPYKNWSVDELVEFGIFKLV